jgi:hypothetical protein
MNTTHKKTYSVQAVCQWLDTQKIPYQQMTEYQIKIGRINFYPGKGTCFRDGDKTRYPINGLDGLKLLLEEEGFISMNTQ